ncbi:hypothetical protein J2T20_003730 [Paenibacillus wynnii]|nr:hypothetical protein [Paenibacillus wynnii]
MVACFGMASKPVHADGAAFSDVKGHWAESVILQASKMGIINGFPDGTFRPNEVVKADQFVTMMLKTFSKPDGTGSAQFDQAWMDSLNNSHPSSLELLIMP